MKKRILLLSLIGLTLMACGNNNLQDSNESNAVNNEVSENVTEEKPEDEDKTEENTSDVLENNLAKKDTLGENLQDKFIEFSKETSDAKEIADKLIKSEYIEFAGDTVDVEEGYLAGFNNYEVKGFKKGAMFCPMIGSIPFVGYVFELNEDTNIDEFKNGLEANADLRWNICNEADQMIIDNVDNIVFFVMCPKSFDEE